MFPYPLLTSHLPDHGSSKIPFPKIGVPLLAEAALAKYAYYFLEELKLKNKQVNTVAEIEETKDAIWKVHDKAWEAQRAYERLASDVDPEEELLKVRINVRKSFFKVETEESESELCSGGISIKKKEYNKTQEQQLGILENAFTNGSETEFKNNLKNEIKKQNPDLDDDIINDLVGE